MKPTEAALIDAATDGVLDLDLALGLTCGGSMLRYLTVSRELFLARALPRASAMIIGTAVQFVPPVRVWRLRVASYP